MHSVPRAAATASAAQSLLGRREEKGERVQVLDQAMMDGGGRQKGSASTASSVEAPLPLRQCVAPGSPNVGNVDWRALSLTLCSAL